FGKLATTRQRRSQCAKTGSQSGEGFLFGAGKAAVMYDEMTIDDAVNIANAANDSLARHADEGVRELVIALKQLVSHIGEQSREIERERARRHSLGEEDAP